MKVLYLSEFVVGRPDGPGVNEFEFAESLAGQVSSLDCIYERHKLSNKKTKYEYLIRQIWLLWECLKLRFKRKKYDILIARCGPLPIATLVAVKLFKCPVYVKTVGDGKFKVLSEKGRGVGSVLFSLCKFLWTRLLKEAVAVDAVSKSHAESFANELFFPLEKCHVIDNGVNTNRFDAEREDVTHLSDEFLKWKNRYKLIIGYVGGYPLVRGASQLICLAKKLHEKEVGVLIVGGDEKEILEAVNEVGVKNIYVAGQVDYDYVPEYMASMDVGVSLLEKSAWGASEQKLRQYISSGIISVCTKASNQDLIDDNVVIAVDKMDLEIIEDALYEAMEIAKKGEWKNKLHRYAEEKLSIEARTKLRLQIIMERIRK